MPQSDGSVGALIAKLSPRVLAALLVLALFIIAGLMSYTLATGGSVESAVFSLKPSSGLEPKNQALQQQLEELHKTKQQLTAENSALKAELATRPNKNALTMCETELAHRIPLADVVSSLDVQQNPESWRQRAATLLTCESSLADLNNNFHFKLIVLERYIVQLGRFIATHIEHPDRIATYKHIQSVLQDVGCFPNGTITGDQTNTREAVIRFQTEFNSHVSEQEQLKELGAVGFGTLEAIRSTYRVGRIPACSATSS